MKVDILIRIAEDWVLGDSRLQSTLRDSVSWHLISHLKNNIYEILDQAKVLKVPL